MTTSDRLRVGLIGANGRWAPTSHIPAIQKVPQTELYAVCTAHEDTARAAAQKYSVELAYHDSKAMLANPQIEAVAVVVRLPLHYALAKNALEAGKPVYCEWPLTATLKETEELAALARKRKVHTMVGLQRRASPTYLRLRELVQEGDVGQGLSGKLTQIGGGQLDRPADRLWQRDAAVWSNTLSVGFGHAIDALCMVVGQITEVSGVVSTQVKQWYNTETKQYLDVTAPDNIMISGRLESGAVVNASVGGHARHGSGNRMEIYGKEGTLMVTGGGEGRIMGGRKDDKALQELPIPDRLKWVPQEVQNSGSAFMVGQMWANFARAIRTNQRIEPDFDSALRLHKLLDAVQRASDTGVKQQVGV